MTKRRDSKKIGYLGCVCVFASLFIGGCTSIQHSQFENTKHNGLSKYTSADELNEYLQKIEKMHEYKKKLHDAIHEDGEGEHHITITGSRVSASQV